MNDYNMICRLLISGILFLTLGCQNTGRLKFALQEAGKNRLEIEKILDHYPRRSLKYKAAVFLVENMPYHRTLSGKAIDVFRDSVINWNKKLPLNRIWQNILIREPLWKPALPDIQKVVADDLIHDIDFAFQTWEKIPWKDSISFDMFKEYILPYSVGDEPWVAWREELHDKYLPLIEGMTDPKEAFDKLYTHIVKKFKLLDASDYSYVVDPLIVARTMRGSCNVRTMYIVYAARSLCIPAAFDYANYWANYTDMGHSWVAYIDSEEQPYLLSEHDKKSNKRGIIDATYFPSVMAFDTLPLPYTVDSLKRVAKIMRRTFASNCNKNAVYDYNCPDYLCRADYRDVSASYGFVNKLEVKVARPVHGNVYLCNFVTGKDWTPIYAERQSGRRITFEGIAGSIVYLPAVMDNDGVIPLTNPVIIGADGGQRILNPNFLNCDTVKLWRKYLMLTRWLPNRWGKNIGVAFEASDDAEFRVADTLHLITQMPTGITSVDTDSERAYRYVRVNPLRQVRLKMSEVAFYGVNEAGEEKELTGEMIYRHIPEENAGKLFDKDYLTEVSARANYYWVGLDLGKGNKAKVIRITYCPWNDGNMVEPGNKYELLYYDMGWHSLGLQVAEREYLTYGNVPKNALLWLRNLTKGKEERVFTYENGKQVWW